MAEPNEIVEAQFKRVEEAAAEIRRFQQYGVEAIQAAVNRQLDGFREFLRARNNGAWPDHQIEAIAIKMGEAALKLVITQNDNEIVARELELKLAQGLQLPEVGKPANDS